MLAVTKMGEIRQSPNMRLACVDAATEEKNRLIKLQSLFSHSIFFQTPHTLNAPNSFGSALVNFSTNLVFVASLALCKKQENFAGSNSYVYVVLTKAIRCSYALQRLFEIPCWVIYDKCCDVFRPNGIVNNKLFELRNKYFKTLKIIGVMDAT